MSRQSLIGLRSDLKYEIVRDEVSVGASPLLQPSRQQQVPRCCVWSCWKPAALDSQGPSSSLWDCRQVMFLTQMIVFYRSTVHKFAPLSWLR